MPFNVNAIYYVSIKSETTKVSLYFNENYLPFKISLKKPSSSTL